VIVLGPPGIGKSRLVTEVSRVLERDDGVRVHNVVATRTASTVPLGALAHLAPANLPASDPGRDSPFGVIDAMRAALAGMTGDGDVAARADRRATRPLLVVDDAHLLDPLSLVVIDELVVAGSVFLLATARSTEELSDGVTALWRSGRATRVDLAALTRDQVDALLHIALGAPVDGATTLACWNYSQGNVLALHELVFEALERGVLVETAGLWRLTGPILGGGRLSAVVDARLHGLAQEERDVLELLSIAEELGLPDLERLFTMESLEHLERQGLLSIMADGRRLIARIGHPLYAEAVRAGLSTLRARQLRRKVIELLEGHGARRRTDEVRIVSLRVDNNEPGDPDILLRAAVLARHVQDHATVERLARLAHEARPTTDSARLLGEALFELARFDESLEVLETAEPLASTPDATFNLAFARAQTLFFGLGRGREALDCLDALAEDPAMASRRTDIGLRRAGLAVWAGEIHEASTILGSDVAPADPVLSVELEHARQTIDLVQGRIPAALEAAEESYHDHLRHQASRDHALAWVPSGMHRLHSVWALIELGRFDEAQRLLDELYAISTAPGLAGPLRWFTIERGRLGLAVGRLATAERWFREAAEPATGAAQPRAQRLALAGLAMAAGQRGDAAGAADAMRRLDAVRGDCVELADTEWDRGHAWSEVAGGRLSSALAILLEAAARARAAGRLLFEHRLLHTVVRLGDPKTVSDRLRELTEVIETPFAGLAAQHAASLVAGAIDQLEGVAEAYRQGGYVLYAAEALGQASTAARAQQDQRRATRLAQRSAELAGDCEGASTPALLQPDTVTPLSTRELEVALLLVKSASNKEISAQLYLSVRTVENHVRSILVKLGVPRRSDVAAALGGIRTPGRGANE
jgi:DNA-binding NarL/FixJ family response regulator